MKQKRGYDAKALFMQGLMAFGNIFQNIKVEGERYLTNKQRRGKIAFKAACAARRLQRKLAA